MCVDLYYTYEYSIYIPEHRFSSKKKKMNYFIKKRKKIGKKKKGYASILTGSLNVAFLIVLSVGSEDHYAHSDTDIID